MRSCNGTSADKANITVLSKCVAPQIKVRPCDAEMATGFVHIAAGFCVVEHPLLPGNILLTLVHRDTPFLLNQNVRSVLRGRIYLHNTEPVITHELPTQRFLKSGPITKAPSRNKNRQKIHPL